MSWLSSFMNPGAGYEKGQEQFDKYYNQAQGYQEPYNQQGQQAYGQYSGAMNKLLDPAALQDEWSNSYKTSDSARNDMNAAQQHGLDAASSMGLMGSSPALSAIQGGTSQIGANDKQQYLDNLMQKYMQGTGIAGNIYGTGANAAGQMGQNAINQGQNSAEMAYGRQNAGGDLFGKILGQGIGAAGSALGGPMGGALAKRWGLGGGA